jgi:hypothetical protein
MKFDIPSEGEHSKIVRVFALFRNAESSCEHGKKGERPTCGVGMAVLPVEGREREGVYRRLGWVWCLKLECFDGLEGEDIVLV